MDLFPSRNIGCICLLGCKGLLHDESFTYMPVLHMNCLAELYHKLAQRSRSETASLGLTRSFSTLDTLVSVMFFVWKQVSELLSLNSLGNFLFVFQNTLLCQDGFLPHLLSFFFEYNSELCSLIKSCIFQFLTKTLPHLYKYLHWLQEVLT